MLFVKSGMSAVLPTLFIGSKSDAKNLDFLLANRIFYILNVTPTRTEDPVAGVPNYFEKDGRFTYRRLPIYDNTSQTITMYLGGCVSFIKEGHCYGNVLVHCAQGVSRSVSVVLAYLMAEAGLTLGDALAMCKKARPQIKPNDTFMKQLADFERSCVGKGKGRGIEKRGSVGPALPPRPAPAPAPQAPQCEECEVAPAVLRCGDCSVAYCDPCCEAVHGDAGLAHDAAWVRLHTAPAILATPSDSAETEVPPAAAAPSGSPSPDVVPPHAIVPSHDSPSPPVLAELVGEANKRPQMTALCDDDGEAEAGGDKRRRVALDGE